MLNLRLFWEIVSVSYGSGATVQLLPISSPATGRFRPEADIITTAFLFWPQFQLCRTRISPHRRHSSFSTPPASPNPNDFSITRKSWNPSQHSNWPSSGDCFDISRSPLLSRCACARFRPTADTCCDAHNVTFTYRFRSKLSHCPWILEILVRNRLGTTSKQHDPSCIGVERAS